MSRILKSGAPILMCSALASSERAIAHPSPFDSQPRYRSIVEDPFWYWLYLPLARLVERGTRLIAFLQQGRIAIYLLFSFVTLLTLLVLTR